MASSSDSMDNTFRARVQKIFGSLSSSSSSLSPLWSLTDDEVEKREWRRPSSAKDDDQTAISFSFDGLFARNTRRRHDLQDINNDDDQLGGGRHSSEYVEGDGRDEWEIRSPIGLDSTLDNEMTTVIAIEDVRREVKILQALTGHRNLVQCYDCYENDNIFVVMELWVENTQKRMQRLSWSKF
ncbi:unnamed protein product [Camellia sinensis]